MFSVCRQIVLSDASSVGKDCCRLEQRGRKGLNLAGALLTRRRSVRLECSGMLGQLGGTEARAGFRVLVAKQVVAHAKELRRGTRSIMLQALGQIAGRLLRDLRGSLAHPRREDSQRPLGSAAPRTYHPLQRVIITDDVARTLFGEYA